MEDSASEIHETTSLDDGGDPYNHILVRRIFEVFCITIHPKRTLCTTYPTSYKLNSLLDGNPCHIYGLVRIFSQDGHVFDIYNRKEVNPDIVHFDDSLSITSGHVISPTYLKVVVYLYDMAHDAEIANGIFDLDYLYIDKDYDKLNKEWVGGQHGFAYVHYSTFQHANVANVENIVLNQVGDANNCMLRTVTARISTTYEYASDLEDDDPSEEFPPSILFQNKRGSEPFHFDVPVKLFRTSIVVPAFCHLVISFSDNADCKLVEDIIFDVRDGGLIRKSSQGQCCELRMDVKWRQSYASEATQPVLSDTQSSSNIASAIPKAFPCVEIFSVSIWINDVDADISGTIVIMDSSSGPFCIFEGQQYWYPGTTLPILSPPRSFDDQPFKFIINIQDKVKRCVSKGTFEWNSDNDNDRPMSFYDKPLCSVIQGEIGYAAVHYTMFTCGIQARIRVTIEKHSRPEFCAKVYGKITAEYSGYKYPSLYDKEYYKSTIFSKPQSDCVSVKVGRGFSELPLAKSVMAVPLDELLVLDVNLVFLSPADGNVKELDKNYVDVKERLEYVPNVNTSYGIGAKKYGILVYVDWSDERK